MRILDHDVYSQVKRVAMVALSDALGVPELKVKATVSALLRAAENGELSEVELDHLQGIIDDAERVNAIDSPWTFGQRYMRSKFVSTDPLCPKCDNFVPHRTLIKCPTCQGFGPWRMVERALPSSHVHTVLTERVAGIFNNTLMSSETSRADGMYTAVPRGGAKSTWLCEITTLWAILTGRSRCVLVLSNIAAQASERALEIKTDLESNELIVADFGIQEATRHSDKRKWVQDDFILANGSRVVAGSTGGTIRGIKNQQHRPDLIIADDADDAKYLTTDEQADKLYEWWDRVIVPACDPNAITFMHGTVVGDKSLLWKGISGGRGATAVKTVIPAIRDMPGCRICGLPSESVGPMDCPVCDKQTEAVSPSSFWGARFTVEALQAIRRKIGHWAFEAEYQQRAHDNTNSWWEKPWVDRSRVIAPPVPPDMRRIIPWQLVSASITSEEMVARASKLHTSLAPKRKPHDYGPYQLIVQGYDPAWAREKDSAKKKNAYMASITGGLTYDDKFVFWGISRERGMLPKQYRTWMYDLWQQHATVDGPSELVRGQTGMIIERNAAGVIFQSDVEDYWPSIPVIDHQTGTNKHSLETGIPGMAGAWQDNRVIVLGDEDDEHVRAFCSELALSGKGPQKDLLMAAWIVWLYMTTWLNRRRDPARYEELVRRTTTK